jgi:hypothetical protein
VRQSICPHQTHPNNLFLPCRPQFWKLLSSSNNAIKLRVHQWINPLIRSESCLLARSLGWMEANSSLSLTQHHKILSYSNSLSWEKVTIKKFNIWFLLKAYITFVPLQSRKILRWTIVSQGPSVFFFVKFLLDKIWKNTYIIWIHIHITLITTVFSYLQTGIPVIISKVKIWASYTQNLFFFLIFSLHTIEVTNSQFLEGKQFV